MKIFIILSFLLYFTAANSIIIGAVIMNRGLNFWKGTVGQQLGSPLFKVTVDPNRKWSPPERPDLVFWIPREFAFFPNSSIVRIPTYLFHNSYESFMEEEIKAWNFSIEVNRGKYGLGLETKESQKIVEYLSKNFTSVSRAMFCRRTYTLFGSPNMRLDDIFQMNLDSLPSTPKEEDLSKFKTFLDYYGGWFSWRATFGGCIKLFTFVDKEISESRNTTWVKEQMQVNYDYYLASLFGYDRKEIEKKFSKQFRDHSHTEVFFVGGLKRFHRDETMKEWVKSVDDESGLLDGSFKPISDVIQDNPTKKKNLEWMIKTYSETGKLVVPTKAY